MDLIEEKRREKMREYLRKWRAANPEKKREYQRKYQCKYYAAYRDKIKLRNLPAGCRLTNEQIAIAREQIRKGLPINFKGK